MRILLVDDDEDIRAVLALVLAAAGHQVEQARDGVDALARLRRVVPDLMLLDMMMPRMDGEELLRTVRRDRRLADVPVVLLSGHQSAREKAAELGADGCLVKPIELEDLVATIDRLAAPRPAVSP
jgi:CheY-like chemotaxis protein